MIQGWNATTAFPCAPEVPEALALRRRFAAYEGPPRNQIGSWRSRSAAASAFSFYLGALPLVVARSLRAASGGALTRQPCAPSPRCSPQAQTFRTLNVCSRSKGS